MSGMAACLSLGKIDGFQSVSLCLNCVLYCNIIHTFV